MIQFNHNNSHYIILKAIHINISQFIINDLIWIINKFCNFVFLPKNCIFNDIICIYVFIKATLCIFKIVPNTVNVIFNGCIFMSVNMCFIIIYPFVNMKKNTLLLIRAYLILLIRESNTGKNQTNIVFCEIFFFHEFFKCNHFVVFTNEHERI